MAFVLGELLGPFPLLLPIEEFARLDDLAAGGVQLECPLIDVVSGRVLAHLALDLDFAVGITLRDHFEFAHVQDVGGPRSGRGGAIAGTVVCFGATATGPPCVDRRGKGRRSLLDLLGPRRETRQHDAGGAGRTQKNLVHFHRNAS